ncbi:MAG: hypothetical protein ACLGIE_11285 [Alphaproteobacteria bacterium]
MSEQTKDGGPAFPVHGGHHPDDDPRNQILGGGMSLRDWFAGQAMASLILVPATAAIARQDGNPPVKTLALAAYEAADAMLAARGK